MTTFDALISFYHTSFVKKFLCIAIVGTCILLSVGITLLKDMEIQSIKNNHHYNILIERAAKNNFDSVKRFLKVAPESIIFENTFSDIVFGKEMKMYFCKLPEFSIKDGVIIFNGEPTFETKVVFQKNKTDTQKMSIDEVEKAISEK